jgi:hypothetical protein
VVTARALPALVRTQAGVALIAAVLTGAVAIFVISPRFGSITSPSLIDDWDQLYYSPTALHQLEHLSYDPKAFDPLRYRPSFWGVWSYLQWHTFGAPQRMRGPNAWNLIRIGALALALALMAIAAVHPRRRREQRRYWLGLLAAVPGILLFSTPAFGVDLARFGPQEPLLIASLGLGGLALVLAVWMVLERKAHFAFAGFVGLLGLLVWTFGVYMKEAAVCVFVLAPFLALELRARWHPPPPSRARISVAVVIGLLALAPLLQLTVQLVHIGEGPKLVYGAVPPHGLGAWVTRSRTVVEQQWNGIPTSFGQGIWQGFTMALPPLLLAVWLRTRRPQWLALGMLLLGWSVLVFQGLPMVVDPRYYMPAFAAFAISLVVLLAELPAGLRTAVMVGVAVLAANGVATSRSAVQKWVAGEQSGELLVHATAQLNPRLCPVYYTNFDPERHASLPVLIATLYPDTRTPCQSGAASLVVEGALPNPASQTVVATCAPPGWQPRVAAGLGTIYSCARLRRGLVPTPDGTKLPPAQILSQNRLIVPNAAPGSGT